MSRYIDADAIDYRNDRVQDQSPDFIGGIVYANACVKQAPTIDIVRCKDCRWAYPRTLPGETGYRCVFYDVLKAENGYCDNGESK